MLSQPSTDWKGKADTLIRGLITDGLFAQLAALYLFNVEAFGQELPNAISASYTMTPNGSLALTPRNGIAGNGSTGFYDTNYPFVSGAQQGFSFGVFVVAASDLNSVIGTSTAANILSAFTKGANSGVDALMRIGMSNQCNWTNSVGEGHFAAARASGGGIAGFQDGVQKFAVTPTNVNPDGSDILFMRRQSVFSVARLGAGWLAPVAISAGDMTNLHARLATFLASVT